MKTKLPWLLLLAAFCLFSQGEPVQSNKLFKTEKNSRPVQFEMQNVSLFLAPDYQVFLNAGVAWNISHDDWKRMQEFGKSRGYMIDDPGTNGTVPSRSHRRFKAMNPEDAPDDIE
jgi:hypothetical protein